MAICIIFLTEFLQSIWLVRAFDILFDKNCMLEYNFFLVGKVSEFVRSLKLFSINYKCLFPNFLTTYHLP